MIYEYWLAGIEGISNLKKRKLREVYGNGKAIYYIEETQLRLQNFLTKRTSSCKRTNPWIIKRMTFKPTQLSRFFYFKEKLWKI